MFRDISHRQLYSDETYRDKMRIIFEGEPSGRIALMTLQDAFGRIAELEQRVEKLERLVGKKP